MRTTLFFISICTLICFIFIFASKDKLKNKYLGQRIPPDMEFIPGNGSISSFFIGKSEETNLNYAIYMDWLHRVYVDLPQVERGAKPHDLDYGELSKFNDPYLQGQLRNPAFAYYPVTGCDWYQVQDYMGWKTDRLNEEIMIETGYFKYNPMQTNSDNYNLEAYVAGQYVGLVKKEIPELKSDQWGEKDMAKYFPFLFTGYRLPTEEEWEYATSDEFQNTIPGKTNRYPVGEKFFLFHFIFSPNTNKPALFNYVQNAGQYESSDLNRIKGYSTYDTRQYGVFNMGNNVEEWLMDKYTPAVRHYPNTESIYAWNGFRIGSDSDFSNADGYLSEKDSVGRMPYRIMGFRNNGEELKIARNKINISKNYVSIKIRNPDSLKIKFGQQKWIDEQVRLIEQQPSLAYGQYNYNTQSYLFTIFPFQTSKRENLKYYRIEKVKSNDGKIRDTLILDRNLILNSKKYADERNYITFNKYITPNPGDSEIDCRVVKTGTWKNPSKTARRKMKETDASANVGFRTVIQYYGMPIDKKKMVRWK
jgi:formylglycine-generating enzyme required for sulfatase activity